MKIRFKLIISFVFFIVTTTIILFVAIGFYSDSLFQSYAIRNFNITAELIEVPYFTYIETLGTRAVDWTSDSDIRLMTEKILEMPSEKRAPLATELGRYLREEKMVYDPSLALADVLDKDGIVIASSHDERIGADGKRDELGRDGNIKFFEAIKAGIGKAFITPTVLGQEERQKSMIYVTARIFSPVAYVPLDAVLSLHFLDVNELRGKIVKTLRDSRLQTELLAAAAAADRFALSITAILIIMSAVPIYVLAKRLTEV